MDQDNHQVFLKDQVYIHQCRPIHSGLDTRRSIHPCKSIRR